MHFCNTLHSVPGVRPTPLCVLCFLWKRCLKMTDLELLAACILSGQVPAEDVPMMCRDNPGLVDLLP